MEAQSEGIGYEDIWAEPGMPPADVLGWFDDQLAVAPPLPIAGLDLIRVAIAHCSESAWTIAAHTGAEPALPEGAIVADWMGPRSAWPTVGRAALVAAVPTEHNGLYLVCNHVGAAVRTALSMFSR